MPGAEQFTQPVEGLVDGAGEAGQNLTDSAQDFGSTATDIVDPYTQR